MQNERTGNVFFQIAKGVGLALAFSFLAVIIFASVKTAVAVPEKWVRPVNQTIKALSVALGAFLCVRGEKGLLQGAGIGALFTALSFLTFSALGGTFALTWLIFAELGLAVLIGGVFGALAVNIKRE